MAQTEQQWVSNNVWVVDQAAWDETVWTDTIICSCGATFGSTSEWSEHVQSLGWGTSHSYRVESTQTTVHHDEVGHWEDQGYYQTVTTGYVCSGCGAVQ